MKQILLTIITLFIVVGCKVSDLKLTSPTSSNSSANKVNFDHNLFLNSSCIQCHENKRPITTPLHGSGGDCITCHTPVLNLQGIRTWKNLSFYNHNPLPTQCISCHESKRPVAPIAHAGDWGKTEDCATCHTFPTWTQAKFTHAGKTLNTCTECHLLTSDSRTPGALGSLHPNKFYLQSYTKGIELVGAVIKPGRIYVHNRTVNNAFQAVKKYNDIINIEEHVEAFATTLNSYLGLMKHYKTYKT